MSGVTLLNTRLIKRCCALIEAKGYYCKGWNPATCLPRYMYMIEDMSDSQELDVESENLYHRLLYRHANSGQS